MADKAAPSVPAHIAPYVRILGVDLAVEFLLAFGGAQLYIAPNPKNRSRLATLVGVDKARELARVAEDLPARVPTAKPWIAAILRTKNLPVSEIARRLHSSDVSVRAWLKKHESSQGENPQFSLF